MTEQASKVTQAGADASDAAPLGGTRAEAVQRLQVGLSGLAAMVLLVGLANIIQDRARVSDALSVPEAAPTVEPSTAPQQRDPLADAGVVPDLPAEPEASTAQNPDEALQAERSLNENSERGQTNGAPGT